MKTTVLAAVAGLAVASLLAAPAVAQPYGGPPPRAPGSGAQMDYAPKPGGWEINRRGHWLQERINRGRADGSLDRVEFRRVEMELNHIRRDDETARAANGGHLPATVRADLEARLDRLSDQIHWLRANDVRRPW